MHVTNITNDYDYDNITFTNCTANENNIGIIIPSLLLIIPCGLSFLCLLSLMAYTLIKPLFSNKYWKTIIPKSSTWM